MLLVSRQTGTCAIVFAALVADEPNTVLVGYQVLLMIATHDVDVIVIIVATLVLFTSDSGVF